MFMPLIIGYLVHDQLRRERDGAPASSPWGLLWVGAGLAAIALDSAIRTQLLAAGGLVLVLPGLALLLLGSRRTRLLLFPLAIAPLMLPIPASFVTPINMVLRVITSIGVEDVLGVIGVPVMRDGTLLLMPGSTVRVADACSGFMTLYASVTVALVLAHLCRSRLRSAVLLLGCVPIAIATNVVRVTILTLMVHYGNADLLETRLHELSGMASFAIATVVLFWIAGRDAFHAPEPTGVRVQPSQRHAPALALLAGLALIPVAINSYVGRRVDDCAHPEALVIGTGVRDPALREERGRWFHNRLDAFAWREGSIPGPPGAELRYAIARTWDPKRAYHRPEFHFVDDHDPAGTRIEHVEVRERTIPVHVIDYAGTRGLAPVFAYVLAYDGEPVANPYLAQLAAAPRQMLRGGTPMTLWVGHGRAGAEQREDAVAALLEWMAASWQRYEDVCVP